MLSFFTVGNCYHFYVIIFPCIYFVLSFMLSFDVIIYCYHFPPFIFFLKTWHTQNYNETMMVAQSKNIRKPRAPSLDPYLIFHGTKNTSCFSLVSPFKGQNWNNPNTIFVIGFFHSRYPTFFIIKKISLIIVLLIWNFVLDFKF